MNKRAEHSVVETTPAADIDYHYTVRVGASDWPQARVGGKADGLHRLVRHGFTVPRAFCILTDAFERVVARCVKHASSLDELRAQILEAPLPDGLFDEISARMDAIGAPLWAVRSSALEEDTLAHSFAGQQATVLEVETPEEVVQAVRHVWASLYDVQGLLYRNQLKVDLEPRPMAVVVQRMVSPSAAGVMFTQNPVTADPTRLVINAASGLGTTVVGGGAADTYYLEKKTGYVERHEVGSHGADSHGAEEGGVLDSAQLDELAACARRLDELFDHPQDVEWAYAPQSRAEAESGIRGKLFLLQARPITQFGEAQQPSVWTNVNVGEALPGVATPLTWSIIRNFSRRGFEQAFGSLGLTVPEDYELVGSFRGRVYLNLSQFMSVASAIPILSPDTLFEMAGGGGVDLVRGIYESKSPVKFLAKLPVTAVRVVASQLSMPVLAPMWGKYFEVRRDAFFQRDLSRLNHLEFSRQLDGVDSLFDRTGLVMLACSSNFLMSYVVMRELLKLWGGPKAAKSEKELVSALEVDSAAPGLDLLNLGRLARRSRRLRRVISNTPPADVLTELESLRGHDDVDVFMDELDRFRRRHGHRAPREAELATPRWREDTHFLFEVVRSYIRAPHLPTERELQRERERTRKLADQLVGRTFPVGLESVFRALLEFTRSNVKLREFMRARVVDSLDMYRRYFLECGRRLVLQDALRQPEDVFYLRYDELRDWLADVSTADDFATRVLVRRALHDSLAELADPPSTFVLEGSEIVDEDEYRKRRAPESSRSDNSLHRVDELHGLPGSAGKVTGRARVITDPNDDASIEPGEILVAPYTDVGWTPLFLTASGVVMGLGGPLSHSCIVAREYGIPTVVNAHGAVDTINTGDLITVDGDRGVVYIRERSF
ncbi:PEP/pyruvate-binding domain-containing protein [Persicimonas caeni]|nr:PEP/pyruvate-binding domain-containing protein [Persicimonas caeni]